MRVRPRAVARLIWISTRTGIGIGEDTVHASRLRSSGPGVYEALPDRGEPALDVVAHIGRHTIPNRFPRSAGLQEVWDYVAIPTEEREASETIGRVLESGPST